jgi:hypothetical protein
MLTLDIFKNDAFSMMSLTTRINEFPYVPGQIGRQGIHDEESVSTTVVAVENNKGKLVLVPNTPRSAAANRRTRDTRSLRYFSVPHLPLESVVTAEEIQNVRPLPGQGELEVAQSKIDTKMKGDLASLDATVEYGRAGSVKGIIYDADGSTVLYNLYTEFNVAQQTTDYVLGTAGTVIIGKSNEVKNKIEDALEDAVYTKVVAICGKTFFDRLITQPTVRDAYLHFEAVNQATNPNRDDLRYIGFEHGGITYVQYRGKVGGVSFVADNEAHAYPVGVPELFKTFFAPANYMETVNTPGMPRYAKMGQDPSGYNKYLPFETQANPLSICTRPGALIKLTTSN